jgi:hypothetical protein
MHAASPITADSNIKTAILHCTLLNPRGNSSAQAAEPFVERKRSTQNQKQTVFLFLPHL